MAGKNKELRAKVKELTEALEKEQSANKLNTVEFQVRFLVSLKHSANWDRVPHGVLCRPPQCSRASNAQQASSVNSSNQEEAFFLQMCWCPQAPHACRPA